jgi:hypothetical protein
MAGGSGFQPRFTRAIAVKTAPTIRKNKVSFPIRLAFFGQQRRSYETTGNDE